MEVPKDIPEPYSIESENAVKGIYTIERIKSGLTAAETLGWERHIRFWQDKLREAQK